MFQIMNDGSKRLANDVEAAMIVFVLYFRANTKVIYFKVIHMIWLYKVYV
jgi:hypothetical protein